MVRVGRSDCSGATPSSPDGYLRRHIGAGFVTEWGEMSDYTGANFSLVYWTRGEGGVCVSVNNYAYVVSSEYGAVAYARDNDRRVHGLCVYP